MSDTRREAIELATLPYDQRKCPACERGEKSIKPPNSSIVGSCAVHTPSGNICIADMGAREYEIYQSLARARAAQERAR